MDQSFIVNFCICFALLSDEQTGDAMAPAMRRFGVVQITTAARADHPAFGVSAVIRRVNCRVADCAAAAARLSLHDP
jgi:hypothetical protein